MKTFEQYLKSICKDCKKANGYCISNETYIGLCSKNDREELLEIYNNYNNLHR